ncbi:hypothetical protein MTR67_048298 [Solanum verrucosum]|uniref:Polyprotein n=1 Tax=Solanum verrucosum TaxID=315347 RepID=A0AAF0V172_SOLVR|nr:hypothetical protein MTR67_048298 [Solanum verrucosum]
MARTYEQSIGRQQITKVLRQLASLGVRLLEFPDEGVIVQNAAKSSFVAEVKEKQYTDPILLQLKENVQQGMTKAFELTEEGVLQCQNRLCVPNIDGLRRRIMMEAHHSRYSVHPGSTKMYHDLKEVYWWGNMKKSIAEFVAQCPNCQQGVMIFGKKGKLSPRYIGPYKIIRRVGQVAYELELSTVHPVFHVSMLRKCIGDPSRITPTEDVHVKEDLTYEEVPIAILDRQVKKLRNKEVASVKVLWRNQQVEEVTWEVEEAMKSKYPHLFQSEEKGQSVELRQ